MNCSIYPGDVIVCTELLDIEWRVNLQFSFWYNVHVLNVSEFLQPLQRIPALCSEMQWNNNDRVWRLIDRFSSRWTSATCHQKQLCWSSTGQSNWAGHEFQNLSSRASSLVSTFEFQLKTATGTRNLTLTHTLTLTIILALIKYHTWTIFSLKSRIYQNFMLDASSSFVTQTISDL